MPADCNTSIFPLSRVRTLRAGERESLWVLKDGKTQDEEKEISPASNPKKKQERKWRKRLGIQLDLSSC